MFGVNLFPSDDDTHILMIIIVVINVRKFTSLARHHDITDRIIHNIVIIYKGRFPNGRFSHTIYIRSLSSRGHTPRQKQFSNQDDEADSVWNIMLKPRHGRNSL